MNGSSGKHQQIFAMPPNTRFQPTPLRSLRGAGEAQAVSHPVAI
jgi:hypothetical protein